jgi:Icc-related predicted phosphoesterase
MQVRILSLSDIHIDAIYSSWICTRFKDIDLIIGCGDLAYYYLEFIVSMLNKPLYYVRGNHASVVEYSTTGEKTHPHGGVDLHRKVEMNSGLIFAGIEGSLKYRSAPYQYTQSEMWGHIFRLIPSLIKNRAVYGRYLDIFVTHAPPWGIQDKPDPPHQGIKAFRWFLEVFKPGYHFHGHIHLYRQDEIRMTKFINTSVINTYGYLETIVTPGDKRFAPFGFLKRQNSG